MLKMRVKVASYFLKQFKVILTNKLRTPCSKKNNEIYKSVCMHVLKKSFLYESRSTWKWAPVDQPDLLPSTSPHSTQTFTLCMLEHTKETADFQLWMMCQEQEMRQKPREDLQHSMLWHHATLHTEVNILIFTTIRFAVFIQAHNAFENLIQDTSAHSPSNTFTTDQFRFMRSLTIMRLQV